MLQRQDFYFDLPSELIAQQPPARRGDSRLLTLDGATGQLADCQFRDLPNWLQSGDLLIFNDTRVIPARLSGRKISGGRVELLVERVLDEQRALAQIRSNRAPKPGSPLLLDGGGTATVLDRQHDLFEIRIDSDQPLAVWLEQHGRLPLPPYITREPTAHDAERYQTVYARQPGAVAAPTAGLHFDPALLARIAELGVASTFITLHVGAGTFQSIRVERITEHVMHSERFEITPQTCEQIRATRKQGGRVIAVGTTTLRALETASDAHGIPQPGQNETRIFIYPGYRFRCVDALITNFHLPESTLLMLVAAFAGRETILRAYRHAVAASYRFFSYGDAMFITRAPHA